MRNSEETLRNRLRFHELAKEARDIVEELDITNKMGMVTEYGYNVVHSVCEKSRKREDISEALEILGEDRWNRLIDIWAELKSITMREKKLRSRENS